MRIDASRVWDGEDWTRFWREFEAQVSEAALHPASDHPETYVPGGREGEGNVPKEPACMRKLPLCLALLMLGCSSSSDQVSLTGSPSANPTPVPNSTFTPPFLVTAGSGANRLVGIGDGGSINVTPLSTWMLRAWYSAQGLDPESSFNNFGSAPHPKLSELRRGLAGSLTTTGSLFGVPQSFDSFSTPFIVNQSAFDAELDGLSVVSSSQLAFRTSAGQTATLNLAARNGPSGVTFSGTETRDSFQVPLSFTVSAQNTALPRGGQLRGIVATGAAVAGAPISVVDSRGVTVGNTITAADGSFSLPLTTANTDHTSLSTTPPLTPINVVPNILVTAGLNVVAVGNTGIQQVGDTSAYLLPVGGQPFVSATSFGSLVYAGFAGAYSVSDLSQGAKNFIGNLSFNPGPASANTNGLLFMSDNDFPLVHSFSIQKDGTLLERSSALAPGKVAAMVIEGKVLYVATNQALLSYVIEPDGLLSPTGPPIQLPGPATSLAIDAQQLFVGISPATVLTYAIATQKFGALTAGQTFSTLIPPGALAGAGPNVFMIGPYAPAPPGQPPPTTIRDWGIQAFQITNNPITVQGPFIKGGQGLGLLGNPSGLIYVGITEPGGTNGTVLEYLP